MAKDVRALREEAAEATASGKYKRALAAYLELERLEPRDAQWAKRAGETYKRLGNNKHAIEAFERSADRYAQNGFLVQAIAVCKLVLQIDPQHQEALRRLATMNEQLGAGPTRAAGMAENNPNLHENPNVAVIRRGSATVNPVNPRSKGITGRIAPIRDTPSGPIGTVGSGTGSTPIPSPVAPIPSASTGIPKPIPTPKPIVPQTQPIGIVRPASVVRPGTQPGTPPQPQPQQPQSPQRQPSAIPAHMRTQPLPGPHVRPAQPEGQPSVPRTVSPAHLVARTRTPSPPVIAVTRTKSKPIQLPPGAALDEITLANEVPDAHKRDESKPGITVIPIDIPVEDDSNAYIDIDETPYEEDRVSGPIIEVEPPDQPFEAEIDESTELELDDLEEIPLPEPLYMGAAAHRALQATPLFAGLPSDALEALVENLSLAHLEPDEVLFREGDPGDALYVIVEGEVSVQAEGPPRVEMARLGAGSFIGEVALMTDQPRSATVTSVGGAELLRIDRHTLSRVLANHGDVLRAVLRFVRDRLVDRWMRTSPLFRPFDDQQRAELASKFNFLEIEDGTRLIDANTKPDGLYIVLAGNFVVQRESNTLATLGAGELIGETALLSGGVFKSTVSARGKSLALHLPASAFREMIMTHPHVLEYIGEQAEHSRRLQIL